MADLVDMKRSKADKKDESKKYDSPSFGQEDYHHGLSVSLGHEELSKLGIHTMPQVGDKFHMHAHAHVTSAHEHSREGGKKERRIELQLRKMAVQNAGEQDTHEGKLKGAKAAMDKALDKEEGQA